MDTVITAYALAFFNLVEELDQIDFYNQEILSVRNSFEELEVLARVIENNQVAKKDKKEILVETFGDICDPYTINFLKLLVDKGRIAYIVRICDKFHTLCNEHENVKDGVVYSIFELSEDTIHRLADSLSKRLNATVVLKNVVDKTIIGGVKVVVENQVFDDSIKYRFDVLKRKIVESLIEKKGK